MAGAAAHRSRGPRALAAASGNIRGADGGKKNRAERQKLERRGDKQERDKDSGVGGREGHKDEWREERRKLGEVENKAKDNTETRVEKRKSTY